MTQLQRLRQGYGNNLFPTYTSDGIYMYYADHEMVVSLLREQLAERDKVIADKDKFIDSLLTLIPKYNNKLPD